MDVIYLYYGIIVAAVVMFGLQFFMNQDYEKKNGNDLPASMVFIFGSSIAGFLVLLAINKFNFEFTYYTLFMAIITALNMIACIFCSLKSLARINLSLYSIFSMLGTIPFPHINAIISVD